MADATNVDPPADGKRTSRIIEGMGSTMQLDQENAQCHWNDSAFNKGDRVSVDGKTYECTFGCWVNTDS